MKSMNLGKDPEIYKNVCQSKARFHILLKARDDHQRMEECPLQARYFSTLGSECVRLTVIKIRNRRNKKSAILDLLHPYF